MPTSYYSAKNYEARRSIGYLLRRGGKLITGRIEELFVEEDLTFVQWVAMMNLRDNLATTAAELCQALCHDSGALTRIIDQMEQRGWVKRERRSDDRRVIDLALTAEGRAVTESYLPRVVDLYNTLFEDFTAEEADTTVALLTRLVTNLSKRTVKED